MATTLKLTFTLCLFAVAYFSVSEAAPRMRHARHAMMSINEHLLKNCLGFFAKMYEENEPCDSEIIDHVHDHAEDLHFPGYDGDMVEDYLDLAKDGGLCYLEGSKVERVKGDCKAMELVCQDTDPKVVDLCSRVKKQAAMITPSPPPTELPTTAPTSTTTANI